MDEAEQPNPELPPKSDEAPDEVDASNISLGVPASEGFAPSPLPPHTRPWPEERARRREPVRKWLLVGMLFLWGAMTLATFVLYVTETITGDEMNAVAAGPIAWTLSLLVGALAAYLSDH